MTTPLGIGESLSLLVLSSIRWTWRTILSTRTLYLDPQAERRPVGDNWTFHKLAIFCEQLCACSCQTMTSVASWCDSRSCANRLPIEIQFEKLWHWLSRRLCVARYFKRPLRVWVCLTRSGTCGGWSFWHLPERAQSRCLAGNQSIFKPCDRKKPASPTKFIHFSFANASVERFDPIYECLFCE